MNREQIKAIMLASGFKEKDQGEGVMDLNPYVYAAAEALLAAGNSEFVPLAWTDPVAPHEHCPFDHLTAQSPIGQYRIQWKGWRQGEPYALFFNDKSIQVTSSLADAKHVAKAHMADVVSLCKPFTYSSMQSTNCAGCGKHKHTPLRVDPMGGYVCLTCIDQRLEGLLAEDSARDCEKDWEGCQEVADLPAVDAALKAFSFDPTGDNGVEVIRAVVSAVAQPKQVMPALNEELENILGRPNFTCSPIAALHRRGGATIAKKSEAEQAFVIHWMLDLYFKHGADWMKHGNAEIARIKAGAAEAAKQ